MYEHLNTNEMVFFQMLIMVKLIGLIFFFLLYLSKDNLASAKITFAVLRDAGLFGCVAATNSTLGYSDHLLS
jgi:hypothetical protein